MYSTTHYGLKNPGRRASRIVPVKIIPASRLCGGNTFVVQNQDGVPLSEYIVKVNKTYCALHRVED